MKANQNIFSFTKTFEIAALEYFGDTKNRKELLSTWQYPQMKRVDSDLD